jgi:hypothetical protein
VSSRTATIAVLAGTVLTVLLCGFLIMVGIDYKIEEEAKTKTCVTSTSFADYARLLLP